MGVLFDVFNGYSDVLKRPLKSKKVQGIFGETFIFALSSSAVFRLQKRVSDFF